MRISFTFLSVAETEHQDGSIEYASRSLDNAETGYRTILHFLDDPHFAKHLSAPVLAELGEGAANLRAAIDRTKK